LALPIAALYAATVTYGRLSADNEFVACRSGGINIHLLLLPTLVISLVSALCSFLFINFLIPGMIMNIDRFIGSDLARLIKQRLSSPRRLSLNADRYRFYADRSELVVGEGMDDQATTSELRLEGAAFVEMDEGEWARIGTAESLDIQFQVDGADISAQAVMRQVSYYDAKAGSWSEHSSVPIDRVDVPQRIPLKVKWLNLGDLLYFGRQPTLFPKIEGQLNELRAAIARAVFYKQVVDQFRASGQVVFGDDWVRYVVRSGGLSLGAEDRRPLFQDEVTIEEIKADGSGRRVTSTQAAMLVDRSLDSGGAAVYLQADGDVSIVDSRQPELVLRRERERLDRVALDEAVIEEALRYTNDQLLDVASGSLGLGALIEKAREKLVVEVDEIRRDIIDTFQSRMAFSMSVFVLVILGAVLGILFRGAHVLTAFGISFVPSLFVVSTIIMGKQLVGSPGTSTTAGVVVIWSGILIVAGVDLFVMTRVLRR
jgi:lipopolysaccharide export LptBFGC system permease protein LptF